MLLALDLSFGKCLPTNGNNDLNALREPLDKEASDELAAILEELRVQGYSWDDELVQCRMQGALLALRQGIPIPFGMCENFSPRDDNVLADDPSAIVRYAPRAVNYADEVYFPPMKKGFAIGQPPYASDPVHPHHRSVHQLSANPEQDDEDLQTRVQDIKNRIELRKMLADYTAGDLKPPIYLKDDIVEDNEDYFNEPLPEERYYPQAKRQESNHFREFSPQQNPQHTASAFVPQNNEIPFINYKASNGKAPESGVYTEGGLVYLSPEEQDEERESKYIVNRRVSPIISATVFLNV